MIFAINHVLGVKGKVDPEKMAEVGRLVKFLRDKGVTPVVLSNHEWTMTKAGAVSSLEKALTSEWGVFPWFQAGRDGCPYKPRADSTSFVLEKMGWKTEEAVFLGNSEADMRTAVNGNLLFLNAVWYGKNCDYGFHFESTRDVARFVDLFCLRDALWHFHVSSGPLNFYALAPFSTKVPDFTAYSADARQAAKFGGGHLDFWTKYLWSAIYFSGLHAEVDYIAPYPGHRVGFGSQVMDSPMSTFALCFRKRYLKDLVVRHKDAVKSAYARANGQAVDVLNQLNSIQLTELPLQRPDKRYVNSPVHAGKTVLLVDDICTQGHSLEAGRAFIEQTGASVVSLSWLKTINTAFQQLEPLPKFNPYVQNVFKSYKVSKMHPYHSQIVDDEAAAEIAKQLSRYDNWKWPVEK